MKKLFLVLLVAVMGFLALVALQPSTFEVSRSGSIPAPPAAVFAMVNDFHRWEAWSPWAKLDPNARMTYEGSESGPGAVCRWSGNKEVGEGKMTIVETQPEASIRIRLEFIKPMSGKSDVEFDFEPAADGTQVTWSMNGENNLVAKAMCLFMDMDKRIGGDMARGLANLRAAVPAAAPSAAPPTAAPAETH
jgi:uncharacterized protein YndB with AHSA1/START domain